MRLAIVAQFLCTWKSGQFVGDDGVRGEIHDLIGFVAVEAELVRIRRRFEGSKGS
jgi:hypothetical protein